MNASTSLIDSEDPECGGKRQIEPAAGQILP